MNIAMFGSDEETENVQHTHHWYRLDNAALVFPAVLSTRITTVFRISLSLKFPVKAELLQQALENIIPRFPYYKVHLRRGLFWYFFEANPEIPEIFPENRYPCSKINLKHHVFPFRVKTYRNRIAVEFCHLLTDGTGALTFLKSLAAEYLSLTGVTISDWGDIFRKDEPPEKGEFEYSYKKYYRKNIPGPPKMGRAFHIPFRLEYKGVYRIITGIVPSDIMIAKAREKGVSISIFLAALVIESVYRLYLQLPHGKKRVIRLLLAVNLRKLYPSITMRNFTLMVTPEIDPRLGSYTFEEILKVVNHYLGMEVSEKLLARQISRNVGSANHPVSRLVPRILKDLFFMSAYKTLGEYLTTLSISNLGKVNFPECMAEYVDRFDFLPTPSPIAKKHCSVISYNNRMHISFGRVIRETRVEQYFFSRLAEMGIPVRIETN